MEQKNDWQDLINNFKPLNYECIRICKGIKAFILNFQKAFVGFGGIATPDAFATFHTEKLITILAISIF